MIELSINEYISHLTIIQSKLNFYLEAIKTGNYGLIPDLALKLRILYMKKSGTKPLLTIIEELLNVQIKVWVRETFDEELKRKGLEHLIDKQTFSYHNEIDYWLVEGTYKSRLIDAINRPKAIKIGENDYSVKDIIEITADKLGGAHIDSKLNTRELSPLTRNISFGDLNPSEHLIIQATIQSIQIIKIILDFYNFKIESDFIELKY